MTLRTTIGRALHAMTTTSAPRGWDEPAMITTTEAAEALGLTGREQTRHVVDAVVARDAVRQAEVLRGMVAQRDAQLRDAGAELEDARRQLRLADATVARLQDAGEAVERRNAALTRDVALRTTQRDKARSDRDRALAELEALRAEVDPPC